MAAPNPASADGAEPEVTIERRVEWHDTDAAGHHHHSVILRWVESAEAELLRQCGIAWLFGSTPRVRHEINYRSRLWFGETAHTRVRVAEIGRSSLRFAFEVRGPSGPVADGSLVIVHAAPDSPSAQPWPYEVRTALGATTEAVA